MRCERHDRHLILPGYRNVKINNKDLNNTHQLRSKTTMNSQVLEQPSLMDTVQTISTSRLTTCKQDQIQSLCRISDAKGLKLLSIATLACSPGSKKVQPKIMDSNLNELKRGFNKARVTSNQSPNYNNKMPMMVALEPLFSSTDGRRKKIKDNAEFNATVKVNNPLTASKGFGYKTD